MAFVEDITINGIKVSKRAVLDLTAAEKAALSDFLLQKGSYTTITMNTGVSYPTIKNLESNGFAQVCVILKIRDFLSKI